VIGQNPFRAGVMESFREERIQRQPDSRSAAYPPYPSATHNILGGGATLKERQTATVTLKFDPATSDAYHDHYIAEGLVTWTISGSDGACSYSGTLTAPLEMTCHNAEKNALFRMP
jgi:phage terminase large subunit-like protein